jgi:hypothetical protein
MTSGISFDRRAEEVTTPVTVLSGKLRERGFGKRYMGFVLRRFKPLPRC